MSELSSYELLPRSSSSFEDEYLLFDGQVRAWPEVKCHNGLSWCWHRARSFFKLRNASLGCAALFAILVTLTPIFNPSYVHKPSHYTGSNRHSEKVFIAACIVDAELIRGAWGKAVLDLIDIIGSENTFLSVYENDSGPDTRLALQELSELVPCKFSIPIDEIINAHSNLGESSIVSEHLPLEQLPHFQLSSGQERTKRITYLAEIRNRAMRPLYNAFNSICDASHAWNISCELLRRTDKVLFLNDVVFSAQDAADLLFATKSGPNLPTNYRAACAVDFINPIKFYDTFATRDIAGYGIGVPFFPWFSTAGDGKSRQDVLDGTDAVRVRSCWGGMVAFEARWFTHSPGIFTSDGSLSRTPPIRFRAEDELYWEASESCLIHADLQAQARHDNVSDAADHLSYGKGIYLNPYIRVAYSESAFRWLAFSRRFERLYTIPHCLVTRLAGLPSENPRRLDEDGQWVDHKVWTTHFDNTSEDTMQGCFDVKQVRAKAGGFCGSRQLQVLRTARQAGQKMWENLQVPPTQDQCE